MRPRLRAHRRRAPGQDAKALTAQAEHQVRRARRNLAAARQGRRARVLAVDDSPAFLDSVPSLVSAEPAGFEAAGRKAGAVAVLDKRRLSPGVLEDLWSKHRPEP